MSEPGLLQGFSARASISNSNIDLPSKVPGSEGLMLGCEGGAVATGRVAGSGPELVEGAITGASGVGVAVAPGVVEPALGGSGRGGGGAVN